MNGDGKSFFETLKNGVTFIENNVKALKEWNENQLNKGIDELDEDEYNRLKYFDEMVKNTFSEVSSLFNKLKSNPVNLNDLNVKVNDLKHSLINYEESSGIKKYGYKAWKYPDTGVDDEIFTNEKNFKENEEEADNDVEKDQEDSITKENQVSDEEPEIQKIWPTYRDKDSEKSRMLRSTFKVTSKEALESFKNSLQNRKLANADKYLGRTPKVNNVDPDSKRYTMIPKNLIDNVKISPNEKEASQDTCYINDLTISKFSFMSSQNSQNTQNFGCSQSSQNSANITKMFDEYFSPKITKEFQEQFTVEFTPGLTTKRPMGKSRFKKVNKTNPTKLTYKKKEELTPEMPIEAATMAANIISIKKSKAATPDTPTTVIDPHFHSRILSKIRQNR